MATRCRPVALFLMMAAAYPQEFDTGYHPGPRKPFTILDQIEDPAERGAFTKLYRETKPVERRRQSEDFLRRHPQSWLLAHVLDAAAKACIDLNDSSAAFDYARRSLRLLPENPLLLVPLASAQHEQGLVAEAAGNAARALEYLDRFLPPAGFAPAAWAKQENALRAAAHDIVARADVAEGLTSGGPERLRKLKEAAVHLERAWALDSSDAGRAYLLGLTRMSLGDAGAAAAAYSTVYRRGGALKEKAAEHLRRLWEGRPAADRRPFDQFVASLPGIALKVESPPAVRGAAEYAGSEACRECHQGEHAAWQQTGMASMFRPHHPGNVIGDFNNRAFEDDSGTVVARMRTDDGRHYFDLRRSVSSPWQPYRVDFTIGSKWQQAYAARLPNGEIHVFPIQYSAIQKRWVNFWKIIDPPGAERARIPNFLNHSSWTAYQLNCATCHTSQLRQKKPGPMEAAQIEYAEWGVNCDMCHGPSAAHAAAMKTGRRVSKRPMEPPVEFRKLSAADYVAVCAQCHMQSAHREPGSEGELNYPASGDFPRRYKSRPYAEFSQKAFYKDGRFRESTFIVEAFLRTACHRKGGAHCGHCHNPHPADAAANKSSLKYPAEPDRMCLQCHSQYAGRSEQHSRHPASSPASRCTACHMPRIMNSLLFQAASHQIDEKPDADLTALFGAAESPNACLACHADKDPQWAGKLLSSWR